MLDSLLLRFPRRWEGNRAGNRFGECAEWFHRAGERNRERFSDGDKFLAFVVIHGFSRVAAADNVFCAGSGWDIYGAICGRQRNAFAQRECNINRHAATKQAS